MKQEKNTTSSQNHAAESRVGTQKSVQRKKTVKKLLANAPAAKEEILEKATESQEAIDTVTDNSSKDATRKANAKSVKGDAASSVASDSNQAQAPKRRTRKSSRAKAVTSSKEADKGATIVDHTQSALKEGSVKARRPKSVGSNSSPEGASALGDDLVNGDRTSQNLAFASKSASLQSSHSFNSQPRSQTVNHQSDRIAIFIDGSNLFYAASHLNIEVDYRRLLTTLVRGRRLLRAYFYTGVDPQNEKQRGFLLWLNRHGHRVVSKELAHLPDGSRKANMHVEMAVDMMRISEYCPTLTLLGGDGNLAYALQVLSQKGTFIEVVSLQSMTSDSLIDLADTYIDLADLRDDIKR